MNPNRAGVRILYSMKRPESVKEIKEAALIFRQQLSALEKQIEPIQEVAKREAQPRLARLDTMITALERDIDEVGGSAGADLETTVALAETIDVEISNLIPELEALSQGNPTTVSAVFDASLHAVEQAGEAIKKATAKTPISSG